MSRGRNTTTNKTLKRVADNMVMISARVRKDRLAALRRAQASFGNGLSQGALLDRAIDLLMADMKAKGELR